MIMKQDTEIINILKGTLDLIKFDLKHNPMPDDERLNKVNAIDKIGEAMNLIQETNY